MDAHHRPMCFLLDQERMRHDLDWNFKALHHLNKKMETMCQHWEAWPGKEEEMWVQEWFAQNWLNNAFQVEIEELKEKNKAQ